MVGILTADNIEGRCKKCTQIFSWPKILIVLATTATMTRYNSVAGYASRSAFCCLEIVRNAFSILAILGKGGSPIHYKNGMLHQHQHRVASWPLHKKGGLL